MIVVAPGETEFDYREADVRVKLGACKTLTRLDALARPRGRVQLNPPG